MLGNPSERVREFFLLEEAERKSEARSVSQRETIRRYHDAADLRLEVAEELRGPIQTPAAFVLYRQASFFYGVAYLASKNEHLDPTSLTPEEAFRQLEDALEADAIPLPEELERNKPLLLGRDRLALDRLTPEQADRQIRELHEVAGWLGRLLDPRPPEDVKAARGGRLLALALGVLALVVALGVRVAMPKNVALYKPALASSYQSCTNASGAVDGWRLGQFGFASLPEAAPWLSIDLGSPFAIDRVKVFGRTDGYYDQSIPLALQVSEDGTNYRQVALRHEPFSDYDPWIFEPAPPLVTRYLRLQTTRHAALVLGEVEVYGSEAKTH